MILMVDNLHTTSDDSMSDESEEEEVPMQAVPIKAPAANGMY